MNAEINLESFIIILIREILIDVYEVILVNNIEELEGIFHTVDHSNNFRTNVLTLNLLVLYMIKIKLILVI